MESIQPWARRWLAIVAVAVLGALFLAGCGDDDDSADAADTPTTTEAAPAGSEEPSGSDDSDSAGEDAAGTATASATIGTTVYAFVPGDGAFCRMDENAGALSVSGLVDESTGAEISIDYSADSEPTANVSVKVDGGAHLESSAATGMAPPAFRISGGRAVGGGQFIDMSDPGSEPVDGQITVRCG